MDAVSWDSLSRQIEALCWGGSKVRGTVGLTRTLNLVFEASEPPLKI